MRAKKVTMRAKEEEATSNVKDEAPYRRLSPRRGNRDSDIGEPQPGEASLEILEADVVQEGDRVSKFIEILDEFGRPRKIIVGSATALAYQEKLGRGLARNRLNKERTVKSYEDI
jgi:hypothetical protein